VPRHPHQEAVVTYTDTAWTEAHRREALRRFRERVAVVDGEIEKLQELDKDVRLGGEQEFRRAIRALDLSLSSSHIDRDVRRVRALAKGRLVRQTTWRVRSRDVEIGHFHDAAEARTWIAACARWRRAGLSLCRVTRIRRPS